VEDATLDDSQKNYLKTRWRHDFQKTIKKEVKSPPSSDTIGFRQLGKARKVEMTI